MVSFKLQTVCIFTDILFFLFCHPTYCIFELIFYVCNYPELLEFPHCRLINQYYIYFFVCLYISIPITEAERVCAAAAAPHGPHLQRSRTQHKVALKKKKKKTNLTSSSTSGITHQQAIEAELNNYLQTPDADSEADPLAWWKVYALSFP